MIYDIWYMIYDIWFMPDIICPYFLDIIVHWPWHKGTDEDWRYVYHVFVAMFQAYVSRISIKTLDLYGTIWGPQDSYVGLKLQWLCFFAVITIYWWGYRPTYN